MFIEMINLDDKREWIKAKESFFRKMYCDTYYPAECKLRMYAHSYGLYETPKSYVNGVAYNDGSWLIYNTCRKKGKTLRNKIYCKTKKDLIEYVYGYLCFLKKIGITDAEEMTYYAMCYVIYKLTFRKGLFSCAKNKWELLEMAKGVLKKDVNDIKCQRKDPRKTALDPKIKKDMTVGEKTKIVKRLQRDRTDELIEKWYDPMLSIRKNVDVFRKNNVPVGKATLERYLKRKKEECPHIDFDDKNKDNADL